MRANVDYEELVVQIMEAVLQVDRPAGLTPREAIEAASDRRFNWMNAVEAAKRYLQPN